ncbi:MAG: hypothetical protein KGL39_10505 [Patescibacteria group bacterium]|nr:hypothetical protein [Patescibacteria group bacterium]
MQVNRFPSPVQRLITSYCDLGDPGDVNIFKHAPNAREHWIADNQFVTKKERRGELWLTQTTIGPEKRHHSIDDKPCIVVSVDKDFWHYEEPWAYDWEEWWTEDGRLVEGYGGVLEDTMLLMVWGKFGKAHRAKNYAFVLNSMNTGVYWYRIWALEGQTLGSPEPYMRYVASTYSGHPIDIACWDRPHEFTLPIPGSKVDGIDFVLSINVKRTLHREDGPAMTMTCRDEKDRAKQIPTATEDGYNSFSGPYPKALYYLNDENMSKEDWERERRFKPDARTQSRRSRDRLNTQ